MSDAAERILQSLTLDPKRHLAGKASAVNALIKLMYRLATIRMRWGQIDTPNGKPKRNPKATPHHQLVQGMVKVLQDANLEAEADPLSWNFSICVLQQSTHPTISDHPKLLRDDTLDEFYDEWGTFMVDVDSPLKCTWLESFNRAQSPILKIRDLVMLIAYLTEREENISFLIVCKQMQRLICIYPKELQMCILRKSKQNWMPKGFVSFSDTNPPQILIQYTIHHIEDMKPLETRLRRHKTWDVPQDEFLLWLLFLDMNAAPMTSEYSNQTKHSTLEDWFNLSHIVPHKSSQPKMSVLRPLKSPEGSEFVHFMPQQCLYCSHVGHKKAYCKTCGFAIYCNRECQANDWEHHRAQCAGVSSYFDDYIIAFNLLDRATAEQRRLEIVPEVPVNIYGDARETFVVTFFAISIYGNGRATLCDFGFGDSHGTVWVDSRSDKFEDQFKELISRKHMELRRERKGEFEIYSGEVNANRAGPMLALHIPV